MLALVLAALWLTGGEPTPQARAVLAALAQARSKGLDPADYLVDEADFDAALTAAAERYAADLARGRVEPRSVRVQIDRPPFDARAFVRGLATAADVDAELARVEPQLRIYRRTLQALQEYQALAARDDWQRLPAPRRPVAPGAEWDGVPRLSRLLQLTGDLPDGLRPGPLYTGALVDGVMHFQARHGLAATGVLDARTVRALDVPLWRRALQLELTLERLRWLPQKFAVPPIFVNLPEFRLHAGPVSMKVVVGRAFRHRTPAFAATLRTVVFRPAWRVPPGIARDELLDEFTRYPKRFDALGFEIIDAAGKRPDGADIGAAQTRDKLRSGEWRLRQKPGPRNALGLVKFDFPNRYGVYLHGTPGQELFARPRRDFSHGCIRVEDAQALAQWVLPGWTPEQVGAAMTGDETLEVKLEQPVPVLIVYGTAVVAEDGQVRFYEDIYGLDAELERALDARAQPSG